MQPEFNLDIDTVKKKTKRQKEEELKFEYSQRMFYSQLEKMNQAWNVDSNLHESQQEA